MTDRELLEAAAKAAGIGLLRSRLDDPLWRDFLMAERDPEHPGHGKGWNALTDDGDALRLAVKLGVIVDVRYTKQEIREHNCVNYWLPHKEHQSWDSISFGEHSDPYAATRRAIVTAAAAMAPAAEPPMDAQARADWTAR